MSTSGDQHPDAHEAGAVGDQHPDAHEAEAVREHDPDAEVPAHHEDPDPEASAHERQVSEVSGMDPERADEPITPSEATAGGPPAESGSADEGTAGPDATPHEHRRE